MNPMPDPALLGAYVDGELELSQSLAIEARMTQDASLRAEVEWLRELRRAIADHADYHAAPPALRSAFGGRGGTTPAHRPPAAPAGVVARWFAWRPMIVSTAFIGLLLVALGWTLQRQGSEQRLAQDIVASHVRATLSQRMVDVASSDRHVVKPWLSSRLDFSPPVVEPRLAGSVFLGGRVDLVDGRPVAVLVYQQGPHLVDAFVWPTPDGDRPAAFGMQRGFHLAHWSRAGMAHWVVSDLNADEFAALVSALEHDPASR